MSRVGLLIVPTLIGWRGAAALKEVSDKIGVTLVSAPLDSPFDETAYRRAVAVMMQEGAEAVYVSAQYENWTNEQLIADLARLHKLPTICGLDGFVEVGGLMNYKPDWPAASAKPPTKSTKSLKARNRATSPSIRGANFTSQSI